MPLPCIPKYKTNDAITHAPPAPCFLTRWLLARIEKKRARLAAARLQRAGTPIPSGTLSPGARTTYSEKPPAPKPIIKHVIQRSAAEPSLPPPAVARRISRIPADGATVDIPGYHEDQTLLAVSYYGVKLTVTQGPDGAQIAVYSVDRHACGADATCTTHPRPRIHLGEENTFEFVEGYGTGADGCLEALKECPAADDDGQECGGGGGMVDSELPEGYLPERIVTLGLSHGGIGITVVQEADGVAVVSLRALPRTRCRVMNERPRAKVVIGERCWEFVEKWGEWVPFDLYDE